MTVTDESVTAGSGGVDRREMLRKAAVGGAIVWAAPMVLSSTASGQVLPCTPKCAAVNQGTFTGPVTVIACSDQGPESLPHPSTFQVGAITSAGSGCGCGATPTVTIEGGSQTFKVGNNDWKHGTGPCLHVAYVGRHPLNPNPNPTPIFATVNCKDRTGDVIASTCELIGTFCWTFQFFGSNQACVRDVVPNPFIVNYTVVNCKAATCIPA